MVKKIGVLLIIIGSIVLVLGGFSAGVSGNVEEVNETVQISPEVDNATGEQSILVSFESNTVTVATQDDLTRAETVDLLQTEASQSRKTLIEFAEGTPAVTVENTFWIKNTVLLTVDHDRIDIEEIAEIEGVTQITPNGEFRPQTTTSTEDTVISGHSMSGGFDDSVAPFSEEVSISSTWGVERINAPDVWEEFDTRGENVSVAVFDSGVDTDHPDIPELSEEQWAQWDQNGNELDTDPHDLGEHGTHVSGTVVGGNASGSYIGVAPGVDFYHGVVFFESESGIIGSEAQLLAGMEWAVENEIDVVSMSLGSIEYDKDLIEPVQNANEAGTVVVAAAGNGGSGTSSSPANVYGTISVGATTPRDRVAYFSSGELVNTTIDWWPDPPSEWPEEYLVPSVSAPGVDIKSAAPTDRDEIYRTSRGTSMATPHVAGVVALMLSVNEDLGPEGVRDALEESTVDIDEPKWRQGHGRVDALAAVQASTDLIAAFITTSEEPIVGETVEFEDRSSADPGTSIVEREWDLTGDNSIDKTGEIVTHTYDEPGEYEVTLTVTDEDGNSDTATDIISIRDGNKNVIEIEDWYDLDAIREDVHNNYVLVSDLDENTTGYEWVVNVEEKQFDEVVSNEPVQAGNQFELTYNDIKEIQLGFDRGARESIDPEDIELVDPETGLIEVLVDTEGGLTVTYETQEPQFVGFDSIGQFTKPFSGTLDGQGHEIRGLKINRPLDTQVALFSYTGGGPTEQQGVIKNLTVANSEVNGSYETGLIAANHRGLIIDSSVRGTVVGEQRAGLVAGTTEGKIVRSDSAGVVEAETVAGGLTGAVNEGGIVEESFADAEVTAMTRNGGVVGRVSDGTVRKSYAMGDVTGTSRVGGFAGQIGDDGEVEESFATGAVDGDDQVGGFVGLNFSGIVADSYWDTYSTGQSEGIGAGDGDVTGLTTDKMQGEAAPENMPGLDFGDTWTVQTAPNDYPSLQWQTETISPTADAGDAQTVEEGEAVTLNGTGSSHPEGESLTYSWAQTSGPDLSLTDTDTATPEFTAPEVNNPTDLTFELTVDDGQATDTDTTTVSVVDSEGESSPPTVGNAPPQDLNDDGLYEDIDGDGEFSIRDVQVFFQNYQSDVVQGSAEYFNFSESDPPEVSIGDVQVLFQLYTNW
jgi:subtilisin family serine protease